MCSQKLAGQNHTYGNTDQAFIDVASELLTLQSQMLYPSDRMAIEEFGLPEDIETAIDIGCGNGHHLRHYSEMYPTTKWLGIDANSEMIKKAKDVLADKPNVRLQHESLVDFTTDEKFDAVFTCAVLQYIPEYIDDYFKLVTRILKPGGFLFILETEPAYEMIYPQYEVIEKISKLFKETVIKNTTISRRLPGYMEHYGFKEIAYKPQITNQYNTDAEDYFKYLRLMAKACHVSYPNQFTAADLDEMLLLLSDKERMKGFICNLAGAYVKGAKER